MDTVCASYQALSHFPDGRSADGAEYGCCGYNLFDSGAINVTEATLDKLLKDDLPVVVDFWAPWYGPCRSFVPIFEDVAEKRSGKTYLVEVNIEAERELSARSRIHSIPTIMMFRDGEVIGMFNGAMPKAPSGSWLNEAGQQ